jgi:hypothetical protein
LHKQAGTLVQHQVQILQNTTLLPPRSVSARCTAGDWSAVSASLRKARSTSGPESLGKSMSNTTRSGFRSEAAKPQRACPERSRREPASRPGNRGARRTRLRRHARLPHHFPAH